ncbi:MAG: flagellar protein FliT [Burkholderiaceae bacterium]
MSEQEILLGQYRAVLSAAEAMRISARSGDWPTVASLSLRIRALTDQLRPERPELILGRQGNDERLSILTKLVHIDAEVRYLREPWLARTDALITPAVKPPGDPMAGIAAR